MCVLSNSLFSVWNKVPKYPGKYSCSIFTSGLATLIFISFHFRTKILTKFPIILFFFISLHFRTKILTNLPTILFFGQYFLIDSQKMHVNFIAHFRAIRSLPDEGRTPLWAVMLRIFLWLARNVENYKRGKKKPTERKNTPQNRSTLLTNNPKTNWASDVFRVALELIWDVGLVYVSMTLKTTSRQ